MPISTYAGNAVLNALFNNTALQVATPHISLHTGDPGLTGASEVTAGGNSYARQTGSFGSPSSKAIANDAAPEWEDMPAVTVTHVGVWDAATDGNFLWGGALGSSKATNAGDTFTLPVGDLDIEFDPA